MRYLCIYHITLSIPLIHLQFYHRKRIPDWLKNFQKSLSTRIIFYLIRMESKKKKKKRSKKKERDTIFLRNFYQRKIVKTLFLKDLGASFYFSTSTYSKVSRGYNKNHGQKKKKTRLIFSFNARSRDSRVILARGANLLSHGNEI